MTQSGASTTSTTLPTLDQPATYPLTDQLTQGCDLVMKGGITSGVIYPRAICQLAVTRKLIEQGRIPRDEEVVICITGNGLKTQDAVAGHVRKPAHIKPSLAEFDALVHKDERVEEAALVSSER